MHQLNPTDYTYEQLSRKEWILTNQLGAYSMGTIPGTNTRKYHGLLVASIEPPTKRMVLLANIDITLIDGEKKYQLASHQYPNTVYPEGSNYLTQFNTEDTICWTYQCGNITFKKHLALDKNTNSIVMKLENLSERDIQIQLNPLVEHKDYHSDFYEDSNYPNNWQITGNTLKIEHNNIPLNIHFPDGAYTKKACWYYNFEYLRDYDRGLPYKGDLWNPVEWHITLKSHESRYMVATTEKQIDVEKLSTSFQWETPTKKTKKNKDDFSSLKEKLIAASEKFIIDCPSRTSVIAGYPWFTDWGRDTMISLPGIFLCTGKVDLAKKILRSYAKQMKQGLIPNRFVDKGEHPEYNTVDGTLWYVNSIYLTLQQEWDEKFAVDMMQVLEEIYLWHNKGTLYNIKVDPEDGLLHSGQDGVQLTWMDAKVGDFVVTPRRGKAVEINALWYNALCTMHWLSKKLGLNGSEKYQQEADRVKNNFKEKFWDKNLGYYLDVAEPNDPSLRPNMLFAISLPFSVAGKSESLSTLKHVREKLLTPHGMRTLSPDDADYKSRYKGTLPERDKAYHQGTVWPWLFGTYLSACIKMDYKKDEVLSILKNMENMLTEVGIGGISEVYDGDAPQMGEGCPWQAWSVAEALRVLSTKALLSED